MGKPGRSHVLSLLPEHIGIEREPGELKHLSNRRKRNRRDSASSGERTRKSLNQLVHELGLWGRHCPSRASNQAIRPARAGAVWFEVGRKKDDRGVNGTGWKAWPQWVRAPYGRSPDRLRRYPSSTEHVEPRVNPSRPLDKAKHDLSPIAHPVP